MSSQANRPANISADQKAEVNDARKKMNENERELKSAMEKITDPTIKKALTKLALRTKWTDKLLYSGVKADLYKIVTRINNKRKEHEDSLKKLQNTIKNVQLGVKADLYKIVTRINNKSKEHEDSLKKLQNTIKLLSEKIGAAETMTNLGSGSGSGSTSRKRPRRQLKL